MTQRKKRKPNNKRRKPQWFFVDVPSDEDNKNLADVGDSKVLLPPNESSAYALRNRYPRSARPTQPMNLPGSDHEDRFFEEAGWDGESAGDEMDE